MQHLLIPLTILAVLPAAAQADQAPDPIPSYQTDLDAFQAEQARTGGPDLSPDDRQRMARAAEELAAAMPEPGLEVGAQAPDFSLPNAFGASVRLADLLSEGPVVLAFYRGAWCPYCNLQLRGLQQTLPHLARYGARLVAITPQMPDQSRKQVEQDGYPFEILSDLDDRVMQDYGLAFRVPDDLSRLYKARLGLDLEAYNGAGRQVLPVPATFVIDPAGVVRFAFAEVDYRQRAEPAAILAALAALSED